MLAFLLVLVLSVPRLPTAGGVPRSPDAQVRAARGRGAAHVTDGVSPDWKPCQQATRAALGPRGRVLKCGDLTGGNQLEALSILPITGARQDYAGVSASKIVFLRRLNVGWSVQFVADQDFMRNRAGYVGIGPGPAGQPVQQWIRLLQPSSGGYRVEYGVPRGGPDVFTIWLTYLSPGPTWTDEGIADQFSWNPAVGRIQLYNFSTDLLGYVKEVPFPPGASFEHPLGGAQAPAGKR